MLTLSTEKKIYSVSELNQKVRSRLEGEFAAVWIEGEISNLACPSSGHAYFVLKDATAQIRCALFASRQMALHFNLENGLHVLVKGKISLYETRGEFQLIVETAEIAGSGKLHRAFEALKKKLFDEGLFDEIHKKPLFALPKTIGVITSATGAAIRDILTVLKRRFPNIPVIIYPTLVQGQQASQQIIKAIETANMHQMCDVVILARGGGSLEDLWPFNEESVARAIFASHIPIVSAIGHEIDFTIADFVADLRAPTPSAAAELITPDRAQWLLKLEQSIKHLEYLIQKMLQQHKQQVEHLKKRLRHPRENLTNRMQYLDQLEQALIRVQSNFVQQKKLRLSALSEKMGTLSPLKTLDRGYAILSQMNGRIVQSIKDVTIDDRLQIQLADGKLISVVQAVVS
jgi:exodeoxyribonuclease VII large subunit